MGKLVRAAVDRDVVAPEWIKNGAVPLGIERVILPEGVPPPSSPSNKPWVSLQGWTPDVSNYKSFLENKQLAFDELKRELEAGFLRMDCSIEALEAVEGKLHPSKIAALVKETHGSCLLYTSPSPRDGLLSRMPSSA